MSTILSRERNWWAALSYSISVSVLAHQNKNRKHQSGLNEWTEQAIINIPVIHPDSTLFLIDSSIVIRFTNYSRTIINQTQENSQITGGWVECPPTTKNTQPVLHRNVSTIVVNMIVNVSYTMYSNYRISSSHLFFLSPPWPQRLTQW